VTESAGGGPGSTPERDEARRRESIQRLMTAAEWGFVQARSGIWTNMPEPVVECSRDGHPRSSTARRTQAGS
jgi:hypothetical protein